MLSTTEQDSISNSIGYVLFWIVTLSMVFLFTLPLETLEILTDSFPSKYWKMSTYKLSSELFENELQIIYSEVAQDDLL